MNSSPPLDIVAFRLENGQPVGEFASVKTNRNDSSYKIEGLAPGRYWLVAYTVPDDPGTPSGLAGGYTQAVPCGLAVECEDHSLVAVEIQSGTETKNVDPADWYAPAGTFPPDPLP